MFKKKVPLREPMSFEVLKADMHSHLIPGIDDGSKTVEESLEIIEGLVELGFSKLVTTPHVMSDYYRNSPETILGGLDTVREALAKANIEVEMEAAAEYYLDHDFSEKIGKEKLLSFGDNYVLFELPFMAEPQALNRVIFDLQTNGYKPVLAHVERYSYWHMEYERYQELAEKGVIMQLNIMSLTGHYAPEVKKISERLIDDGYISLLGTDTHGARHLGILHDATRSPWFHKLVESGKLLNAQL